MASVDGSAMGEAAIPDPDLATADGIWLGWDHMKSSMIYVLYIVFIYVYIYVYICI